jgi:cytidylate kinase
MSQSPQNGSISSHGLAEQRMRRWALSQEIEQRLAEEKAELRVHEQIYSYLAISRQAGTNASAIARRVGEQLKWDVIDRDVLSLLLQEGPLPGGQFDAVDETSANWLVELFGKWADDHMLTQMEFVARLGKILLVASHHGNCVFVGRGAQFLLPREKGSAVRLIAPREQRVKWTMDAQHLTRAEAQRWVDQHDQGRHDFIRSYFHHNEEDASLYDLVVNLEYLDETEAAEVIVTHCRHRFARETVA